MIGKDANGAYFVQIKVKDPLTGKWHVKKKRGFKLKREAQAYEREMPRTVGATSDTFKTVSLIWEKDLESSADQVDKHRRHFEKRFADLYNKPIRQITAAQLTTWRTQLSDTNYSTRTKNETITYVKSVFRFASSLYGFPDPAARLKPLRKSDEEVMKEMEVWTVPEFNKFIQCVESPLYRTFFSTLYWTGMRRGEAIALQVSDYSDGWINIHASQRYAKTGLKPTKTRTRRRIKADSKLKSELDALPFKTGYLFGGDAPLSPTTIQRHFDEAVKASGVKKIRIHDLRHSHASVLINAGVNIVAVSKRLGHASIEQTLKTYTHLFEESDEKMMETIDKFRKNGSNLVPEQTKS